jgi:hypothetical protein
MKTAGILDVAAEHTADIVRFWKVRGTAGNKIFIDPLITCLTSKTNSCSLFFSVLPWSMDVLPAQASSVPSERVFSSSKETCTTRRASLLPPVLEALQVLKFSYKQDRLNFTEDLIADEVDYNISGRVSKKAVDELVAAGNLEELAQLLANEDEDVN